MDKLIIFLLFLGPLVFFHELGHYLFARLFGVRVEVFSIGFGPKLIKWTRKGTQYAFSLIPLGGYVKMFGDDPLAKDSLPEEERKYAFTHKGKWARFWIVFGGPLANFILAFVIYFFLLLSGEKVPEPRLGVIPQGSSYYEMGLRTGDILKQLNNSEVLSFDDLNLTEKNISKIVVERQGELKEVSANIGTVEFMEGLSRYLGQLRSPVIISNDHKKYLLSSSETSVDQSASLEEVIESGTNLYAFEILNDGNKDSEGKFTLNLETPKNIELKEASIASLMDKGFYPSDLAVSSIVMGSPADKFGIKKDDIVIEVANNQLTSFEGLRQNLQSINEGDAIPLKIIRDAEVKKFDFVPEVKEVNGEKVFLIGVYSGVEFLPVKMIETKTLSIFQATSKGIERTWEAMVKTVMGFKMLITGEIAVSNIGGPITIGKVASDSFYISFSMFFRLMALISINLGIINLFPIPVLDGGHIMFIIMEIFNRGPLSQKKMQIAQQFGLSLLFMLIFVALFNDISRLFT